MIDRNLLEFDSFIYRSVRIMTVPYLDLIDRSIQYMVWGWGSCSKIVLLSCISRTSIYDMEQFDLKIFQFQLWNQVKNSSDIEQLHYKVFKF
jgi:hypothetical protein